MSEPTKHCVWHQDGEDSDTWGSKCGRYFRLDDGTPDDNHMRWCCYCGKPLESVIWTDEDDEE